MTELDILLADAPLAVHEIFHGWRMDRIDAKQLQDRADELERVDPAARSFLNACVHGIRFSLDLPASIRCLVKQKVRDEIIKQLL